MKVTYYTYFFVYFAKTLNVKSTYVSPLTYESEEDCYDALERSKSILSSKILFQQVITTEVLLP